MTFSQHMHVKAQRMDEWSTWESVLKTTGSSPGKWEYNIVLYVNINIKNGILIYPSMWGTVLWMQSFRITLFDLLAYISFFIQAQEWYMMKTYIYIWVMKCSSIFYLQMWMPYNKNREFTEYKRMKDWGLERGVNRLEAAKVDKIIDMSRGIPLGRRWNSLLEGKEKMNFLPLISPGSCTHLPLMLL